MIKQTAIAIVTLLLVIIGGCSQGNAVQDNGKIKVVTTVGMITDIVENVGGDYVEVTGLMGPGVDPHLYKASEGDVQTLADADIIFYGGLHLEAKMSEIFEEMDARITTVPVSKNIPREKLLDFIGYPGQYDPHIWFDVSLWMSATETVRDTLIEYDPEHKERYDANADAYLQKLKELDNYVRQKVGELPEDKRILVTAHDAFHYFGKAYGFEVVGLQGISTQSAAGTGDVQRLVGFIVEKKIRAIFVESSVPERNIKAVKEAARAKGWDVAIGGELFSDAMGNQDTFEGTYIGMVTHNIDTIVNALTP
ncbi:zinc ABC transporter substrate-binding protein [Candidatus Woesearchaeota archaeon]|nr:zinc ABC transporter substrate-binding protein [Candidatus Woesearchaeota archaeon]